MLGFLPHLCAPPARFRVPPLPSPKTWIMKGGATKRKGRILEGSRWLSKEQQLLRKTGGAIVD